MRGQDEKQDGMFSYVAPEQRVPADHPLRKIRTLVDEVLEEMSRDFSRLYADTGRPCPLRPTEGPLDPPPRPQIGQTWGPSLFAQRRRWFPEATIRELIETGRRVYFRKNPTKR